VHAYVINLVRSPDRRAHIAAELSRTTQPYEFVEGVDGRELDLSDISLVDPAVVRDGSFRRGAGGAGAAGCALSHLKVYRKVVEDGRPQGLVLEDDTTLPKDLAELADAIGRQTEGAEVVLLNFHSARPCRVAREQGDALPGRREIVKPVDLGQPHSAGAYVITAQACERMSRTVLPVRVPADDWGFFFKEGALDRVRCIVPMPVVNAADFRSTIDFYDPSSLQARVRELVATGKIPLLKSMLARRRWRTFQRAGWTGEVEFVESALD
jgi:glycosyl transferase family 25